MAQTTPQASDDDLLSTAEALALGDKPISRTTLQRWIREGKLHPVRIEGRVERKIRKNELLPLVSYTR